MNTQSQDIGNSNIRSILQQTTQGLIIIIQQTIIYLQGSIYSIPICQYSMKINSHQPTWKLEFYYKTRQGSLYKLPRFPTTKPSISIALHQDQSKPLLYIQWAIAIKDYQRSTTYIRRHIKLNP
jgi:hypothetical protein